MKISNYYKNATFYPSWITIIVMAILSAFFSQDYESEWISKGDAMMMDMVFGLLYIFVMNIACLPIFFLHNQHIRNNKLLVLLSWFLCPIGVMSSLIFNSLQHSTFGLDLWYLIDHLPFLVGLIWTYIHYQKNTKS